MPGVCWIPLESITRLVEVPLGAEQDVGGVSSGIMLGGVSTILDLATLGFCGHLYWGPVTVVIPALGENGLYDIS